LTLIEVMVVVIIIAALTAMAVPVLRKSKDQGQGLICANNLRQLGYAVVLYTQNHERYPESFCRDKKCHQNITSQESVLLGIDNVYDYRGYWWFCFLAETIGQDPVDQNSVFRCPTQNVFNSPLRTNFLAGNYGINYSISKMVISKNAPNDVFIGVPCHPGQIISPGTKLLISDSGYTLISWKALAPDTVVYPFENPDRQDAYFLPGAAVNKDRIDEGTINEFQAEDAVKGRHSGGRFNAVFADGHVDRIKPSSSEPDFDATGTVLNSSYWSP